MRRKAGPFAGVDAEKTAREYPPKNCMVGIEAVTVAPGGTTFASATPQITFTPLRLVLARRYPTLLVADLKVGHNSMLLSGGPIPLDTFQRPERLDELVAKLEAAAGDDVVNAQLDCEHLEELLVMLEDFRGNLGRVDTCHAGSRIALGLLNMGPETVRFEGAAFFGDAGGK